MIGTACCPSGDGRWPSGKRTKEVTDAFVDAGGILTSITDHDLKVLSALRDLRAHPPAGLREWLLQRRPASCLDLFRQVLGDRCGAATAGDHDVAPLPGITASPAATGGDETVAIHDEAPPAGWIQLGHTTDDEAPFTLSLESLRRHTVIFAGSGSGKTVLIRRLIEECARQGVSAIVLDPNNDLARLGDAWPQPPTGWLPGDDERARDYHEHTEVVIWTPRIQRRTSADLPTPTRLRPSPRLTRRVRSSNPFRRRGPVAKGRCRRDD
jgi:uncharacterized protein DUF87